MKYIITYIVTVIQLIKYLSKDPALRLLAKLLGLLFVLTFLFTILQATFSFGYPYFSNKLAVLKFDCVKTNNMETISIYPIYLFCFFFSGQNLKKQTGKK